MKKKLLWVFLLLIISARGFTQAISLKGVVSDAKTSETIPGVNISVQGTNLQIATNSNGAYSIDGLKPDAVLIFTCIGYKSQEILLNGRTKLDVALSGSYGSLNEVVVVGFGSKKKIDVAGAIDQISGKELESRPIANVMQGLQGLSPGLNITYPGGTPGTVPTINIRGFTSINGGSPLIVIDGIPAASNDDMLRLTPSDVTSFTILRDAASAAIYGARAAFGVILITTKQGVVGHNTISYNTYQAWGKPTVLPTPVTDPYIYSRVLAMATANTPWDYVTFSDQYYAWAKQRSDDPSLPDTRLNPTDPTKWDYMGSNNWNKYFFNDASSSKSHTLTFSGGAMLNNKPLTYYLSADYTRDNGLNKLAPDYWDRYGLKSRLGFAPLPWLKIDNNLSIYQTKRSAPSTDIRNIYYLKPTDVAKNPDGTWANTDAGRLAAQLVDGGNNQQNMFGFQNITSLTATFLHSDLQINGDASVKREMLNSYAYSKSYKIGWGPNDVREEGGTGSVNQSDGYVYNEAFNLYTTYKKTIRDHFMSVMVGFNSENYSNSTLYGSNTSLISSSLPYLPLTGGTTTANTGYDAYATNSVFSRLNYTYKNRYILEATGRYDGSSRFPVERRWGFFPSASAAWIASAEDFFKPLAPTVSTFKLRTSYGDLGNQNVPNFQYIQQLSKGNSGYLIGGNGQNTVIQGAPPLYIDPQTYTWERVSTLNMGTDIGLLNDRLSITYDYYIRDTKGMLTAGQELPGVLGVSAPQENNANLRTKGWEFSISYKNQFDLGSKPFNFNAKIILSDSKTHITKFKNAQNLFSSYRQGQEIGEIWGLVNDGVFHNQQEVSKLDESAIVPWGALPIVAGWPKYKDLDGDNKIELGSSSTNPKDLKIIGNSADHYSIGTNLNMNWNGIDLSVFLQGVLKRDFYPTDYLFWGPYQQPYANVYPWNLNFYRGTADSPAQMAKNSNSYNAAGLGNVNTNSQYPVLQSWLADSRTGAGLDIPQTKYLLNGAYLRVKNVSLGYSFPSKLVKKIGVTRLRIFVTGDNLYEFSAIKKYIDPEAVNQGSSAWAYPFQRKYALGLNLDL